MPEENIVPGRPCWADLWTSDVPGSRAFYAELFGWKAEEPSAEFGGYFMFTRTGSPTAGGMGAMGETEPGNRWKLYLAVPDIGQTVKAVEAAGGTVLSPPMPVADLGVQSVIVDPTGAELGLWQPGTFAGFATADGAGSPSWFELRTRDYAAAADFYRSVFGLDVNEMDVPHGRYATLRDPASGTDLCGLMDGLEFLAESEASYWAIFWITDDVEASSARVRELGGSVNSEVMDTPYGRVASASDPAGASFMLHQPAWGNG